MPRRAGQRGFTLMETLIASTVLAVCVLAISQLIVAGQMQTYAALHQDRALSLAEAIIEEMVALPYHDPEGGVDLGPDAGESSRADFDNLDDYHGYQETAGHVVDIAGESYGLRFARFSRQVTCADTTLPVGEVDVPGLLVTVTVRDGAQTWTVTRFIPQEQAP